MIFWLAVASIVFGPTWLAVFTVAVMALRPDNQATLLERCSCLWPLGGLPLIAVGV